MKATLTTNFPGTFGSGLRERFQAAVLEGIHAGVDPMLDDVRGQTPYDSIRSAYGTVDMVGGSLISVGVTNSSPIFPFRENDVRPHWAPYGPGSALANWANARGITPFLVARKIARTGTVGNHLLSLGLERHRSQIDQSIQTAVNAFLTEMLTGRN